MASIGTNFDISGIEELIKSFDELGKSVSGVFDAISDIKDLLGSFGELKELSGLLDQFRDGNFDFEKFFEDMTVEKLLGMAGDAEGIFKTISGAAKTVLEVFQKYGPIGGGIMVGLTLLYTLSDKFKKSLDGLLQTTLTAMSPLIKMGVQNLIILVDAIFKLCDMLATVLEPILKAAGDIITKVMGAVSSLYVEFSSFAFQLIPTVIEALQPLIDICVTLIDEALKPVMNAVTLLCNIMGAVLSPAAQLLSNILQKYLKPAIQLIGSNLGILSNLMKGDLDGAIECAITSFKKLAEMLKGLLVTIVNFAYNIVNSFVNVVRSIVEFILTVVSQIINKIINGINMVIKGINKIPGVKIGLLTEVDFSSVADKIKIPENTFESWFSGYYDPFINDIANAAKDKYLPEKVEEAAPPSPEIDLSRPPEWDMPIGIQGYMNALRKSLEDKDINGGNKNDTNYNPSSVFSTAYAASNVFANAPLPPVVAEDSKSSSFKNDMTEAFAHALEAHDKNSFLGMKDFEKEIVLSLDGEKLARAIIPLIESEYRRMGYSLQIGRI